MTVVRIDKKIFSIKIINLHVFLYIIVYIFKYVEIREDNWYIWIEEWNMKSKMDVKKLKINSRIW